MNEDCASDWKLCLKSEGCVSILTRQTDIFQLFSDSSFERGRVTKLKLFGQRSWRDSRRLNSICNMQTLFWPTSHHHSHRASQQRWSRSTIPNEHGHRLRLLTSRKWCQRLKMTLITRPACWPSCGHVRWGRSASQSTASNASAFDWT